MSKFSDLLTHDAVQHELRNIVKRTRRVPATNIIAPLFLLLLLLGILRN